MAMDTVLSSITLSSTMPKTKCCTTAFKKSPPTSATYTASALLRVMCFCVLSMREFRPDVFQEDCATARARSYLLLAIPIGICCNLQQPDSLRVNILWSYGNSCCAMSKTLGWVGAVHAQVEVSGSVHVAHQMGESFAYSYKLASEALPPTRLSCTARRDGLLKRTTPSPHKTRTDTA
eukprot:s738_g20.t1